MTTGLLLTLTLLLLMLFLLAQQTPAQIIRVGCWLVSWGEARREMQARHAVIYARMLEERGQ